MADPRIPCPLFLTFTGAVNNQRVRLLNRSNNEIIYADTVNEDCVADLANFTTNVATNDIIEARLCGHKEFDTTITVNADRAIFPNSVTADTVEVSQSDIIL